MYLKSDIFENISSIILIDETKKQDVFVKQHTPHPPVVSSDISGKKSEGVSHTNIIWECLTQATGILNSKAVYRVQIKIQVSLKSVDTQVDKPKTVSHSIWSREPKRSCSIKFIVLDFSAIILVLTN